MKSDSKTIKFKSKRNAVLLRDGIVEKHFNSAEAAALEALALQNLQAAGLNVPKVYALDGSVLKMQYLAGETLPDLIERWEGCSAAADIEAIAAAIIDWFAKFYNAVATDKTTEIRGDVNGRNFLFNAGHCWGVDFEEKVYGTKEQDIGRLIAFIVTYNPPGTQIKTQLASAVLHKAKQVLDIDEQEILRWRDSELLAMQQRRANK